MTDDDRTVHAESDRLEVVRYARRGKWFVESKVGDPRVQVTLAEAVSVAQALRRNKQVHLGLPGGLAFDARYQRTSS